MFKELKKQVLPFCFGDVELYLRFDNEALCSLENSGVDFINVIGSDAASASALLLAGLKCYFDDINASDTERKDIVSGIMTVIPKNELLKTIINAVLLAFPLPVIGAKNKQNGEAGIFSIMTAFCDIMGKTETEFWKLTLREVWERWDRYAVFMGHKKAVEKIAEFDDE